MDRDSMTSSDALADVGISSGPPPIVTAATPNALADLGISSGPPPIVAAATHEENVVAIRKAVERLEVTVAQTDRKVDQLTLMLKGLTTMTAKSSDGRTLINLVGEILTKVRTLD
jgi:hypothetical protein